jgi:mRNA-degrading endonuclease toxin of MazEF toxin-antitoxin module
MTTTRVRRGQLRRLQTLTAGKLLVAVISSDEMHDATTRGIAARITTDPETADTGVSVPIPPELLIPGWIMPDRLIEVSQHRLGDESLGQLPPATIEHLDLALTTVLGIHH